MALRITGTGSKLPSKIVTNADFAAQVDTSDEWIQSRTGIKQRHFCAEGESTSTLSVDAGRKALDAAGVDATDIQLVIVATTSPDTSFPSVANMVQRDLGINNAAGFDVSAACSGFIYALSVAEGMMKVQGLSKALIIGADTFSNFIDMEDRTTAVLFGDGAGAVVLQNDMAEDALPNNDVSGIIGTSIASDGRHVDLLKSSGGVSSTKNAGTVVMNGREVFKHATRAMGGIVNDMLTKYEIEKESIDWLVPHQANKRIIEATAKHIGLSMDKVVLTVGEQANTSAATIPLALDVAVRDGRIKQGQLLFLEAFGAGFTWGASLVRW